jgi:hypothetical protein
MGAALSIPFLAVPSITGLGGWILSCCGAAAVTHLLVHRLILSVLHYSEDVVRAPPASPLV